MHGFFPGGGMHGFFFIFFHFFSFFLHFFCIFHFSIFFSIFSFFFGIPPPPDGHCAGGTHPTGMHSCLKLFLHTCHKSC